MTEPNYWNMLCPDCFYEALRHLGEWYSPPHTVFQCEPYLIYRHIQSDYKECSAGRYDD